MTNHPPQRPPEVVRYDVGGWLSGPMLPACLRCGQPKANDGNDWCTLCEAENAGEALAALRHPLTSDQLRRQYPGWTITCDGVWRAERREGSALRLVCAHNIAELAVKLTAAD